MGWSRIRLFEDSPELDFSCQFQWAIGGRLRLLSPAPGRRNKVSQVHTGGKVGIGNGSESSDFLVDSTVPEAVSIRWVLCRFNRAIA